MGGKHTGGLNIQPYKINRAREYISTDMHPSIKTEASESRRTYSQPDKATTRPLLRYWCQLADLSAKHWPPAKQTAPAKQDSSRQKCQQLESKQHA
jgi:hypothetical protein